MRLGHRTRRYGSPLSIVVLGVAWAAVDTDRLGNTVGTALIAVGLIAFMVVLGRDLGMSAQGGRVPRVPPPPGAASSEGPEAEEPAQRGDSSPSSPS